ncbi:TPA: QueT transporter family protein, partial [Enterococcus faecium]|nr:QueT transporter family protein [Enterococcus faecium]HAQ7288562.1 QueT transporter family protein [Enterococcus faecium]HAQ7408892.1 QueT transporter family protein [Enterococcus faecium]
FFLNWWVIALGELASMIVGGIIIYWIGKKVDLSK